MPLESSPPPRVRWPEFAHVVFDCDSTLSTVEGIDVLASGLGIEESVAALTDAAMAGDLDLSEVYGARLNLLQPTRRAVADLRRAYKRNIVAEAPEVIAALRSIGIEVYVVSGGLAEPVADFAVSLGIEPDNVRAVEAHHDALSGEWWNAGSVPSDQSYAGFDDGALTRTDGKAEVIAELLAGRHGPSMLVGDGASDLRAAPAVDLFVGFGGAVRREHVAAAAPIYIDAPSLAAVLPIAAGPGGAARLAEDPGRRLLDLGLEHIRQGAVTFRDPEKRSRLLAALESQAAANG